MSIPNDALSAPVDASVARAAGHAEAMARLRRACAGEPDADTLPPPPPPFEPVVDPFRQRSGGSVAGGGNTNGGETRDRPTLWNFVLVQIAILIALTLLG